MAPLTDADLEGLSVEAHAKPEKTGGISVSQIPEALVKLLTVEAPKALVDPDNHRVTIRVPVRHAKDADDKTKAEAKEKAVKTAKLLGSYATAWGKGQTKPRLYITKVPNGKDEKDEPVVHMKVQDWDKVSRDNRPGRR